MKMLAHGRNTVQVIKTMPYYARISPPRPSAPQVPCGGLFVQVLELRNQVLELRKELGEAPSGSACASVGASVIEVLKRFESCFVST